MAPGVESRTYDAGDCIAFRKTNEPYGGLSNMAPGFPMIVNGVAVRTSEALYQACRFPHLPEIQRLIIEERSPMTAKMKSKPYRNQSRSDWLTVRTRIMRWCLRVKLSQNWERFSRILLETGEIPIVEDSRKDTFWGAKRTGAESLIGCNVLGRLLMELREEVRTYGRDRFLLVEPPTISSFLLYGEPIDVVNASAQAVPQPSGGLFERRDRASVPVPVSQANAGSLDEPSRNAPARSPRATTGTNDRLLSSHGNAYPKRLIEVDLPIREISAHARREKSIRHGHISTLHIWWARRPLAACRAVTLAALWLDPADELCPESFRIEVANRLREFRDKRGGPQRDWSNPADLRAALLDFIAQFANWDASTDTDCLTVASALTEAAHCALGGAAGTRPLVIDPFAGGGAIPLEALRAGADVFASDLNPIPVLLNTVVLDFVPRYGRRLAEAVRAEGAALKRRADDVLKQYYPPDPDGSLPLAYIWARTVSCEGPGCGAEIPLLRSMWLAKTGRKSVALRQKVDREARRITFDIVEGSSVDPREADKGNVARGAATCPVCGYTMKVAKVRAQLRKRHGGAHDARLIAVVVATPGTSGRRYRLPTDRDLRAIEAAEQAAAKLRSERDDRGVRLIPDESTEHYHSFVNRGPIYGMTSWEHYFTPRQQLVLGTMVKLVANLETPLGDPHFAKAVRTLVALALSRQVDATSSLCRWHTSGQKHTATFGRQALPMVWDFSEVNVLSGATGGFLGAVEWVAKVCEQNIGLPEGRAQVQLASATAHPLPDDAAHAVVTDPPYYYSVQYADLADFFYVWLRRTLGSSYPELFADPLIRKDDEIIVQSPGHEFAKEGKNAIFYEGRMLRAMEEARRVVAPSGVGVVVFAHKSTRGWEAQLQSMVDAGWIITASWPIDTEMAARVIAQGRAVLASSIHLVCRPRENPDGSLRTDDVGDWRAVLRELPRRIREWMPRLAKEGVVGADAIFACLGPALEVFSRYSRVEKANGEQVTLREYLEHVWAAVAREALSMIFEDADATGLEEDARLTAMWLWTLSTSANGNGGVEAADSSDEDDEARTKPSVGYTLEFDAARKIAQGLGAHLEDLAHVVEVKGDKARLLPVTERTRRLFGKEHGSQAPSRGRARGKARQMSLFAELEAAEQEAGWGDTGVPAAGETTLDRVHQAMILFAAGRGEALKRFLVGEGVGRDTRFWKLAQSLSALYPAGTEEKRWVDGVLARKKGLGFG